LSRSRREPAIPLVPINQDLGRIAPENSENYLSIGLGKGQIFVTSYEFLVSSISS
jgi:hypothetical protein